MLLIGGLAFYLYLLPGTILQLLNVRWGLLITQLLFLAAPTILSIRWFYLDPRTVLPLRRPPAICWAAAVLGTVGLNHLLTLAGAIQERIFPTTARARELFEELFEYHGAFDFIILLVLFALLPAICEELLFRGFLQSGLVHIQRSDARGIALGAVIFAAFHLDPWRFPGLVVLGLFLGLVAQASGSLLPAMLAHGLNNLLAITQSSWDVEVPASAAFVVLALTLLAISLLMLRRGVRATR